jgi:hypothetical protein
MCFVAGLSSMTKGDIVVIIFIDVKGLMMSYNSITIHTGFPRLVFIYRSTSILKK